MKLKPERTAAPSKNFLSNSEQNELLLQLASMLRVTLVFLRMVAIFQMGISIFYTGLFLSGMPPVYVEQVEDRDWLGRQFLLDGDSLLADVNRFSTPPPSSTGDNPNFEQIRRRAIESDADMKALLDFVVRAHRLHHITISGRLALLFSIILLVVGGWSCLKAGMLLRVPPAALVASSSSRSATCDAPQEEEENGLKLLTPTSDSSSLVKYIQSYAFDPLLNHRLWFALSLWPSCYWLLALHVYNRNKNAIMEGAQAETAYLYFGVSSRFLDIVLAIWQPVFHLVSSWMITSMVGARNELINISKLKYFYEKEKARKCS